MKKNDASSLVLIKEISFIGYHWRPPPIAPSPRIIKAKSWLAPSEDILQRCEICLLSYP